MFKKLLASAAAAAACLPALAAPAAGDLAFTSFNADEDGWSMVTFVDLAANTTVYFTDNEWDGSAFNTGESYHQWNTGAFTIAAGTVVRFSNIDNATTLGVSAGGGRSGSTGTLSRVSVSGSTNYGLSATEDTVYAYLGASPTAPTTFLAAISNGSFGVATAGTLTNTGLAIGNGAVQLSASSDYAEYNNLRAGQASFAAYKPLVSDITKWQDSGDNIVANGYLPNTIEFTIASVPEPEGLAMGMAGLLGLGFAARRRGR